LSANRRVSREIRLNGANARLPDVFELENPVHRRSRQHRHPARAAGWFSETIIVPETAIRDMREASFMTGS
jgi:hypothetical protein